MSTTYNIEWSSRANRDVRENIEYLETHWSTKITKKFLARLREKVQSIAESPEMYRATDKDQKVHQAVLDKHRTIYYSVETDFVRIITLWDNRQNPANLEL
jgi:plasmid stabilization system protein ParE